MFEAQDIKIAFIGVTTEYIPFWEKPEHLNGLKFVDAVKSTKDIIIQNNLKEKADLIVVLYHGGFNKNLETNQSYGPPTIENKGYELFQLEDVDVLLTGHQHIPQVFSKNNRIALQTSSNAHDFGLVSVEYQKIDDNTIIQSISGSIVKLEQYLVDEDIESKIDKDIKMTNTFLSQKIGFSSLDMTISSPLACRVKKHPLFQLINQIQLDYTKADISAASLPNETHGFPDQISLNDIAVNFPFENDLVVLEVTGAILKEALEYNANYFSIKDNQIIINPKYLFPKVEHYNYDVYDGIEYEMDISKNSGNRITVLKINHEPVKDKSTYKLVLNSYRSIGSGGFDMFKKAKIIMSYPVSYFDLIKSHIEKHPKLDFKIIDNFKVVK
jgi:2',3'-cyclic-nucleotide 2'-phosphodiesterase/3'-nucleotidase